MVNMKNSILSENNTDSTENSNKESLTKTEANRRNPKT